MHSLTHSAGIIVFRRLDLGLEVLLAHPGGPIWGSRDFWSIPKGELDEAEDHLTAAYREFEEEMGSPPPDGELYFLGSAPQRDGKKINTIWAVEGAFDVSTFHCNTFQMEWPRRSGKIIEVPENDRAAWHTIVSARVKVFKSQVIFLDRLIEALRIPNDNR